MAVKEIVSIDVADESFKRFLDLFEKYKADVAEMPEAWQKVDDAIGTAGGAMGTMSKESGDTIAAMGAATGAMAEALHKATAAQRQFETATRGSHKAMHGLGESAKAVSATIFGIGKWALKFGAIGGALAGFGGAIGMDDLAESAMRRQRSALGVGMKPGQQAAFETYLGQFGIGQNVESGVANIRSDVTKRWALAGMGITPKPGESNFALDQAAVRKAYQFANSTPRADLAPLAQARGFTQAGFSIDTLRQFRHTPWSQVEAALKGSQSSTHALGFNSTTARDWTQFSIALHRAGVEIESSLIVGLKRLTPELTAISHRVSDWIAAFAKGPQMGVAVNEVADGMGRFAKFITSPAFGADMAQFEKGFAETARELVAIAKTLEPYAALAEKKSAPNLNAAQRYSEDAGKAVHKGALNAWRAAERGYRDTRNWLGMGHNNPGNIRHKDQFGHWHRNFYPSQAAGVAAAESLIRSYPKAHHADTLASIYSTYDPKDPLIKEKIAHLAKWTGFGANQKLDLNNPNVLNNVTSAIFRQEGHPMSSTKIADILAKHHARDAAVAHAHAAAQSSAGIGGLPASVDRLVQTLRKQQPHKPVKVTVRNSTAARIAVQANGAAY